MKLAITAIWIIVLSACAAATSVTDAPLTIAPSVVSTPFPSPVPTPSPTVASPTTTPTPADTVLATIDAASLSEHLEAFQRIADNHGGNRATGTPGFDASATYVVERLDTFGYEVKPRDFNGGTNLIADRAGTISDIVMIGAHLDSVLAGPGINDNASGVAALLVIAEALADVPRPERTIRLVFWDAEEGGPFGSPAYVAALVPSELSRIVAYLNLDMIGSPNALRFVYAEADAAPGSDAITQRFATYFEVLDLPWSPIDLEGDSDHGPFVRAGIPTGGLFSGGIEPVTDAQADSFGAIAGIPADACSHQACDTLANVNTTTLHEMTLAVAHVLVSLAFD